MIASLPMYDRAETRAANDRLWAGVRARLGHGPDALSRGTDPWSDWTAPDLLLSQTCGMPYRTRLHGRVALVAAPAWRIEGLRPGYYRSVFVVREDDPRTGLSGYAGARFAFNDPLSQSGWAAPQTQMAEDGLPAFSDLVETGSHRASARAVAESGADIAAIDIVTWAMIARWDGWAGALRPLCLTRETPALPYITAPDRDPGPLLAALAAAIAALDAEDRDTLLLDGVVRADPAAYLAVPTPALPSEQAKAL